MGLNESGCLDVDPFVAMAYDEDAGFMGRLGDESTVLAGNRSMDQQSPVQ